MSYLVIDEFSAEILSQSSITDEWFSTYGKPEGVTSVHRIHIDDIIFFVSTKSDEHTRLLIVDLRNDPFGTVPSASHAFDRILVGALAQFSSRVSIPATWKYFHDDHRFSIYAQPKGVGHGQRIYFDRDLADGHIQVVAITPDTRDFSEVPDGNELSRACASKYIDALIKRDALDAASATLDHTAGAFGIVLEKPIGAGFIQRGTLSEWLHRLTPRQRQFVEARADQPVRLKGVPGTGKTLCLTIKALKEVFSANVTERNLRVAFLTHSSSVAHHVVEGMLSILDPDGSRNANPSCTFWLGSLYELIAEMLDYAGKGIQPLSLDGIEGREEQKYFLRLIIDELSAIVLFAMSLFQAAQILFPRIFSRMQWQTRSSQRFVMKSHAFSMLNASGKGGRTRFLNI